MNAFLAIVFASLLSRLGYQMARTPVLPIFAADLGALPELSASSSRPRPSRACSSSCRRAPSLTCSDSDHSDLLLFTADSRSRRLRLLDTLVKEPLSSSLKNYWFKQKCMPKYAFSRAVPSLSIVAACTELSFGAHVVRSPYPAPNFAVAGIRHAWTCEPTARLSSRRVLGHPACRYRSRQRIERDRPGYHCCCYAHWDHIQGFPFFNQRAILKNEIRIFGFDGAGATFREIMTEP